MMKLPRALVAIGVIVTTATLAAGATATGAITSGGKTLKIVDAFAFDAVGEFGDPVIRIRLSDRVLDQKAADAVIDFLFELDAQRGEAGYLDLFLDRKTSTYQGSTYNLGGNVSCGLCMDPAVHEGTRLRVEAGHVRGTVKVAAGSYDNGKGMGFDLTLDVAVATLTAMAPLANAAASAEAKAFHACRASAVRKDETSRSSCFAPDNPAVRSTRGMDAGMFWTMLGAYDQVFEMTNLKVTAGRTRGEWIELTIEGAIDGSKAQGAVYLRRMDGVIKYSHSVIR